MVLFRANHKEKLNTYQDHSQSFVPFMSVSNNQMQSSASLSAVQTITEPQLPRQSTTGGSHKSSHDNCSSSVKSDSSKGKL